MERLRPKYGWYLLRWSGLWLLLTVGTQLPECYERAAAASNGTLVDNLGNLAGFATIRSLMEIPCGLLWGSLSWLLQWGEISLLRRFSKPKLLQQGRLSSASFAWPVLAAIVILAIVEGVVFGLPLAEANTETVNFSLPGDDAVTVCDRSIMVENVGIILAFVLPTFIAGYMTSRALPSLETEQSAV